MTPTFWSTHSLPCKLSTFTCMIHFHLKMHIFQTKSWTSVTLLQTPIHITSRQSPFESKAPVCGAGKNKAEERRKVGEIGMRMEEGGWLSPAVDIVEVGSSDTVHSVLYFIVNLFCVFCLNLHWLWISVKGHSDNRHSHGVLEAPKVTKKILSNFLWGGLNLMRCSCNRVMTEKRLSDFGARM